MIYGRQKLRFAIPAILSLIAMVAIAPVALSQQRQPTVLSRRVAAPALEGGGEWLNTSGPLSLRDLRGKFVVLDFWTYCCINCLQALPELKKLERAYPNEIVVIGVHSAKFETEQEAGNIREAILRHDIEHPVVNDANLVLWRKYQVNMWPSLRIIDPQGYVIAVHQGEFEFAALDRFFRRAIASYERRGLDKKPLRFDLERDKAAKTPLRFPGKVLADEASGRLFIADTSHNRIVVTALDGKLQHVIGSGQLGRRDGAFDEAQFDHPQGMALLGDTLYVADTENHLIRKVDLKKRHVVTIAGSGKQARVATVRRSTRPRDMELASPWALCIHGKQLYIAMAGTHQIWRMELDESQIGPYAGNALEDVVDGPLLPRVPLAKGHSSFAQPSALASDGRRLFVSDSEGSSIRAVPLAFGEEVSTILGTSRLPENRLFTFGDRDGPVARALLQHPVGLAYSDGQIYVADTYNNKIKAIDLRAGSIKTIAGGRDSAVQFNEPAGLSVVRSWLYVADTNNHAVRVIDLKNSYRIATLKFDGLRPPAGKDR